MQRNNNASIDKPIAVIALKISRNDIGIKLYSDLTAIEKIQRLAQHITQASQAIHTTHPNATIIIVWREYGIYEKGRRLHHRYITDQDKAFLLSTFSNLCKEIKNLIIISGTVAQRKSISGTKAHLIRKTYEQYQLFEDHEKHNSNAKQRLFKWHKEAIDLKLIGSGLDTGINAVKNINYTFYQNQIISQLKVMPFFETHAENDIFQPAKSAIKPICQFEDISIGVEICREHFFGLLKKQNHSNLNYFFHFILSDFAVLKLQHLTGLYNLQLDSFEDAIVIEKQENSDKTVHFYELNVLEAEPQLIPIRCIFPLVFKLTDQIDQAMTQASDVLKAQLEELKLKIFSINNNQLEVNTTICNGISELLNTFSREFHTNAAAYFNANNRDAQILMRLVDALTCILNNEVSTLKIKEQSASVPNTPK